jgi:hypothetical protein
MFQMHDMTALQVNGAYLREFISEMRRAERTATEWNEPASRAPSGRGSTRPAHHPAPCDQRPLAEGI